MSAGRPDEEVALAETFGHVARLLAAHEGVEATLQQIVDLAVSTLDSCEHAGVSYIVKRHVTSPASSGPVPRALDQIQTEVDQGPCLDAIREDDVFTTGDLRSERRWPLFSHRAHEATGVRSVLSLKLFVEDDTMGALNLYSTAPDAFDRGDVAIASVFAAHAAVAMAAARREDELEQKASTRELIGRAKGIVMAESGVDAEEAFDMLRRASQRLNVRILDLAVDIDRAHGRGPRSR